ncbi:MAG: DNA mismatch repair endonuclease MutL [Endomicrobiia bacterium]
MQKIKILPEEVINKIAAGEVIERPASVVKELIENSLDANSKYINIEIEDAGKKLIRVSDDGIGMSPEDVKLCIQRHATSKIYNFSDLETLKTLGFRGEALSSIACVSKTRIVSKTDSAQTGWGIIAEGGKIILSQESPHSKGTTVEVNELFFNTPARKKFLKSDITEQSHIIKTIEELALVHFWVGFILKIDNKVYFTLPPARKIDDRIIDLLGNKIYGNLIQIYEEHRYIKIFGFVSKIESSQANKNIQYFFVNSRPVTSRLLSQALYGAFRDSLPIGRHPMAIIIIETNPKFIDVNVHPTKRIIKFSEERIIHEIINQTIKKHLTKQSVPILTIRDSTAKAEIFQKQIYTHPFEQKILSLSEERGQFYTKKETEEELFDEFLILGQLHNTYIIISTPEGLTIVDQHAANERVLYERFTNGTTKKEIQELLIPHTLEVAPHEYEILRGHLETINLLGFEISEFGLNTIVLKSYPSILGEIKNINDFFKEFVTLLIDEFSDTSKKSIEPREKIIRSACRAAVKAHDRLSEEEIKKLIIDLKNCKQPLCCPHGRPTMIKLTISELEKKFQRK